MDEKALVAAWEKGCRNGEFESILFAVAIKPGLSVDLLSRVFGEAHMIGHTNGRELMTTTKNLQKTENLNRKLTDRLKSEKKNQKNLLRENRELEKQVKALLKSREQKPAVDSIPSHERPETREESADMREREEKIAVLEEENRRLSECLNEAEKTKDRLLVESFDLREVNETLQNEIGELISRISLLVDGCPEENPECKGESCPRYKLCAEKILIVGGVTKIKHLYRDLVESKGGIFDYHDGYMTSGKQNLEARIKRSDLVICPVNCNSHGACTKVKELCRKHNKAMSFLASSSLSAISEALMGESATLN